MRSAQRPWAFVAPALIVIGVFFLMPVLAALALSLTDFDLYALADLRNLRLIGFDNYIAHAAHAAVLEIARQHVLLRRCSACRCRSACRSARRCWSIRSWRSFKAFFRTAYFAPVVTTLVAVAVVWRYIFHTRYGLINYALEQLGLAPIDWLGDPHWSMPAIIILAVWKNFGYNMIILLAALQNIPRGSVRSGAHRRRVGVAAVPAHHAADRCGRCCCSCRSSPCPAISSCSPSRT